MFAFRWQLPAIYSMPSTTSIPAGKSVTYYRLENLSSEWQLGAYNSTNNPFGKVVRCQDCHMSTFPYAGNSNYEVGDLKITSPTPAIFFRQLCRRAWRLHR